VFVSLDVVLGSRGLDFAQQVVEAAIEAVAHDSSARDCERRHARGPESVQRALSFGRSRLASIP